MHEAQTAHMVSRPGSNDTHLAATPFLTDSNACKPRSSRGAVYVTKSARTSRQSWRGTEEPLFLGKQETGQERGRKGADLAHEGLVGVAELAQVQQRLHHWLLQRLLCLFFTVLVPIDIPARTRLQNCLHNGNPQLNAMHLHLVAVTRAGILKYVVRADGIVKY